MTATASAEGHDEWTSGKAPDATTWDPTLYRELLEDPDDGVYFVDRDRVVTHWNERAEELSGFTSDEAIGRRCRAGLLNHVDDQGRQLCTGRCPLASTLEDGQPRSGQAWMNHASGYRSQVWFRVLPLHDPEDGRIVGAAQIFGDDATAVQAQARDSRLARWSLVDPVTGLGNRDYLAVWLANCHDAWVSDHLPFGILLVGIDNFARIHQRYGQMASEASVGAVARTLSNCITHPTIVAGYGDGEFAVLEANATRGDLAGIARRICSLVAASHLIVAGRLVKLSVSVGGTLVSDDDEQCDLLRRAGVFLKRASSEGRNRIIIDQAEESLPSGWHHL